MEKDLEVFAKRALFAEEEIKNLTEEIKNLKNIRNINVSGGHGFELNDLVTENTKLKHRLAILKRAVEGRMSTARQGGRGDTPGCVSEKIANGSGPLQILLALFSSAITKAFPDLPDPPIVVALSPKFGDYQCNSALPISKLLKSQGISIPPPEVGKRIVENVSEHPLVMKLDVAGPGFINVSIDKNYVSKILTNVVLEGIKPPPVERKLRVVVDFSSPNIAKEMHVGHLRSTIIGESLCRVLEFLNHDVLRINHVGDWGTQFGMLIAHLQERFPDFAENVPPIGDLQAFYKEAKVRFDADAEFKKRAYACVVQLQNFEPTHKRAWEVICDVSRREFQKIYKRLGITLQERGESFYQSRMEKLVKWLDAEGYLEEDEGRKIMWAADKSITVPLTIVKSDGGFTYDTSDMACVQQRVNEEKADWIIYITDSGQASHFQILESCAKRAGLLPSHVKFTHVGFGVVLGEDRKKFKTRSGDTIRLNDLLDEGVSRALETLKTKGRHEVLTPDELKQAMESVAYGCIKYADLSHNRNAEYVFSFDRMLEDRGNTAVYLLYNLTRIRSIARTAGVSSEQLHAAVKNGTTISLDHEKEWKLGKVLLRFPDVIIESLKDVSLHKICDFAYEIATAFSEFYDNCYCVEKDSSGEIKKVYMERLLLCEVTATIMAQLFALLGIDPLSRM
ncbi:Probable arginine--tRNA ligase, cytoplasmic [Gryllus bimaculatus]|nr:Probable arginine--tRNA ligase, cytoplasmic [Gryllus bimaculatus]